MILLHRKGHKSIVIDTKSSAYARMRAAGFAFEADHVQVPGCFQGVMTCVCGRREHFSIPLKNAKNGKVDIAGIAERIGAASVHHLHRDGYTREQIMAIRKAFV